MSTVPLLKALLLTLLISLILAQKQLTVGVAQQDWAPKQTMMQYKIDSIDPIAGTNKEIIFIVTPFSGDADVYVKTTGAPSTTDYDLKAADTGADYIWINSTSRFASHTGPYYVGVYAHKSDVTFSVLVYVTDVHIQANEGVPQLTNVRFHEFIYFKYTLTADTTGTLSFSNVAILGDPDIYVSMTNPHPSPSNNTWYKADMGSDLLTISNALPGTYYIAIYGYSRSIFSFVATHSQTQTELIAGVPIKLTLPAGEYAYFRYNLTRQTEIVFQLQKNSWTGDPDLFVSKNYDRPNKTHNEWNATAAGADLVRIPDAAVGTYYISVSAWGILAVTFTLTARAAESSSFLISGEPQAGSNLAGKYDYYKFDFGGRSSQVDNTYMDFTVSPIYGTVELYGGDATKQFPTKSSYTWAGTQIATSSVIHFDQPIATGIYYLGVLSVTESSYLITASVSTRYVQILPGQTYTYQIQAEHYRKFFFEIVDNTQPVIITLYSYQGDADVYVGLDENVDKTHFIWYSTKLSNDVVSIEPEDPHRHSKEFTGRLYVSVYGYRNSYFTLSVATNSTTTIEEGVTVRGLVQYRQYQYYRFWLNLDGVLIFNLRAIKSTDDPDIFVSTDVPFPTETTCTWKSVRYGSDYINIPNALGNRWYYIGVLGWNPNSTFLLSASSDYSVLSGYGYSSFDYVPAGKYRYYGTYLDSAHISATITLITGSTELYMLHNTSKPSRTEYIAKDDSWPGNFVQLENQGTGQSRWTYAVYGVEDSAYMISTVADPNIQGALRVGEPRLGVISNNHRAVFRYTSWFRNMGYYVSINLITEDVTFSVYIDQHAQQPNATNSKWSQHNATDDVVISLPVDQLEKYQPLFIAVETEAHKEVRFQVVLSDQEEPIYLTQEQPNKFKIEANGVRSYEVYSLPGTTGFMSYVDSCDDTPAPQFFMSTTVTKPNSTSHDVASTVSARTQFSQVINKTDTRTTDKLYYVSTALSPKEQYASIYATTNQDLRPIVTADGVLQKGELVSTTTQRIVIPAAATHPHRLPITYEVYKRVLGPDVDPKTVNMDTACSIRFRRGNQKVGTVDVPPNLPPQLYFDLDIASDERYLVNVIARDKYGLESVYKQLGFNIDNTHTLKVGKPIISSVNESQYDQFTLPKTEAPLGIGEELMFVLTPISGDVDLYLSTTGAPTKESHQWKAENGGFDVITINSQDPLYKHDKYYIGVFGASEKRSTFSIMVYISTSAATPIQLTDGQPQVMTVKREKYNYFEYYLDDNSTYSITVAPISGDPDIYVSATTKPSRLTYDWSSILSTLDYVLIGRENPNYKAQNKYQIAVYGWKGSLYTITATKQYSLTTLTEGLAHGGKLARDQFAYFKFTLSSPRSITFTVTPLIAEGDPDLLISTTATRPDYSSATWRQEKVGQDTITIDKNDPKWIMGTYYVAVKAFRKDLTYQITALSEIATTVLTDGNIQSSQISTVNEYKYFRFYHGFTANAITFTATPTTSQTPLKMFVSHTTSKPGPSKSEYEGQADGVNTVVTVPKDSSQGWWYCAITGTPVANFTITAKANQRAQVLIDGEINSDNFVANNYYVYFVYDLGSLIPGASLTISTFVNYGDPDLYLSTNESRPTKDSYMWKSVDPRSDSITIPYESLKHAQTIFIGAYGFFADASFNILAFSSNATVELRDNTAAPGMVPGHGYTQYKYEMTNRGRLKFTLDVLSPWPSNADLYVDTQPNPSKARSQWKSELFGQDYVLLPDAAAGWYYVAVHAPNSYSATYQLLASTEYAAISVGSTTIDFIESGHYRYYQVTINPSVEFILVSLTLINGRTHLVLNSNETRPTIDVYQKKSISWPGNSIMVSKSDPAFKAGTWSIGVYAFTDSDYFLSVQAREGRLTDGQPRTAIISPQFPVSYFVYSVGSQVKDLFINVRVFGKQNLNEDNQTCIVVYGSQKTISPSVDEHTWEARSDRKYGGQVVLTVDKLEPNLPLYLAVRKCATTQANTITDETRFEIISTGLDDPIYLTQDYTSIFSFMNSDYTLLSSKLAFSMNIEFSSCDNTAVSMVDLVADADPSVLKHNATFIGKQTSTFSIAIAQQESVVKGQKYYVKLLKRGPMPLIYSLYSSTTGGKSRPKLTTPFDMQEVDRFKNEMGVTLAKTHIKFPDVDPNRHRFKVVATKVPKQYEALNDADVLKAVNFETWCSVQQYASTNTLGVSNYGENFVDVFFETDARYMVNAIVIDNLLGTESVYTPVILHIIVPGAEHGVSVGGILILVIALLFTIYLIAGSCWNYFRLKHRGIDIIPHVSFWTDLPYLVWDGMKFVATCGRRQNAYETFDDEAYGNRVNVDHEDFHADDNPFKLGQVDEKATTHGYGAI